MFWFEKEKICFENGESHDVNKWLCNQKGEILKMLKSGTPLPCTDVSCKVQEGIIYYETESVLKTACLAFAYAKNYGIDILLCSICQTPFAPLKRNDEKYCFACRKTGASKTFRQKKCCG